MKSEIIADIPVLSVDETSYTIEYGRPVTLTCSIISLPVALTVFWKKNGAHITIDDVKYCGSTKRTPSLKINDVTTDDMGIYVCSATNEVGINSGAPIQLNVTASEYLSMGKEVTAQNYLETGILVI